MKRTYTLLMAVFLMINSMAFAHDSSQRKIYLSHNSQEHANNSLSMSLDDGETVGITSIHGDENGIFIYASDIITSDDSQDSINNTIESTYKSLHNRAEEILPVRKSIGSDQAYHLEFKVVYYPCERCATWRVFGGKCPWNECPTNTNMS